MTPERNVTSQDPLVQDRAEFVQRILVERNYNWSPEALQLIQDGFLGIGALLDEQFKGKWRSTSLEKIIEGLRENPSNDREDPFLPFKQIMASVGVDKRPATQALHGFIRQMINHRSAPKQRGYVGVSLKQVSEEITRNINDGKSVIEPAPFNGDGSPWIKTPAELKPESTRVTPLNTRVSTI